MAEKGSSNQAQEWMAVAIWVGLFLGALASSIYILSSLNLPGQILANFSSAFAQPNPLTGEAGGTALAKGALYVSLLLFVGSIYFMVSAWLKLSSMLLEVVIHYAGESRSDSVFATMLYIPQARGDDKDYNPDDAVGSMPGEIVRNLAFAWVATFLMFGISLALPFIL